MLVSPVVPKQSQTRGKREQGAGRGVGVLGASQLSCGLGDALRDLGELQAGALHHAGLTAALVGTDHVTVAFTVQLVILRAYGERAEAEG